MSLLSALEISVLFVCIWGFLAILLTAHFSFVIVLLCIAGLIIAYYFRRNGWRPSALAANIMAVVVFLVAAVIFFTSHNLLSATVHLFLFLQVTKYVTRRSIEENRWCYLISLFNIIGASVITTTFSFAPVLIVYIFLVLTSLRLYVMAQEAERTGQPKPARTQPNLKTLLLSLVRPNHQHRAPSPPLIEMAPGNGRLNQARLPRRMISSGVMLTISALAMSAGLFSVIPRLATQNLFQSYGPPQEDSSVSAFSENVEFGAFTEIQLDESVAMFVQPVSGDRPTHVRMRGVALDSFDGRAWRRTSGSFNHSGMYEFAPIFTTRVYPNQYRFRVLQPPGITSFLFGDSFPTKLHIPRNSMYQVDRMAQAVALIDPPPREFQYEVESIHEDLVLRRDPADIKTPDRPRQHLIPRSRFLEDGEREDIVDPNDDETSLSAVLAFFGAMTEVAREENITSPSSTEAYGEHDMSRSDYPYRMPGRHPAIQRDLEEDTTNTRAPGLTSRSSQHLDISTTSTRDFSAPGEGYDSSHWRPSRAYRRLTGRQILNEYLEDCLQVPENLATGPVPELAQEWTKDQPTTFTKAMAIESRLRTQFGYSLTPRATGNYIENFLMDVREGHCEYFATSMAILLRNLGIPARVVNGFYSTEWNTLSGNFTVRQKDAHSWVEAWMGDDYGWMTFDPTPPTGVARRGDRSPLIEAMARISDAVRMRWYRYVIDYSFSDQVSALRQLAQWRQNILGAIKSVHIPGITGNDARTIEESGLRGVIDWRPAAIALSIIMLLLLWQIVPWISRKRRQHYSPIIYYDELLQQFARRGLPIAQGETPQEYAVRITKQRPEWAPFQHLTAVYYRTRYMIGAHTPAGRFWWSQRQTNPKTYLDEADAAIYDQLLRSIKQNK